MSSLGTATKLTMARKDEGGTEAEGYEFRLASCERRTENDTPSP